MRPSSSSCCRHPGRTGEIREGLTRSLFFRNTNSRSQGCPGGEEAFSLTPNTLKPYCGLGFARLLETAQRAVSDSGTTRGTITVWSAQAPEESTRAFEVAAVSGEQLMSYSGRGARLPFPVLPSTLSHQSILSTERSIQSILTNTPVGSKRAKALPQGSLVEGMGGGGQERSLGAQAHPVRRAWTQTKLRHLSLSS